MNSNHDQRDRVMGVVSTDYKFTDWLDLALRGGTDFYRDFRNYDVAAGWIGGLFDGGNYSDGGFQEVTRFQQETNTDFLAHRAPQPALEPRHHGELRRQPPRQSLSQQRVRHRPARDSGRVQHRELGEAGRFRRRRRRRRRSTRSTARRSSRTTTTRTSPSRAVTTGARRFRRATTRTSIRRSRRATCSRRRSRSSTSAAC